MRGVSFDLSVTPMRFERMTYSLEGCCSIQLSYGIKKKWVWAGAGADLIQTHTCTHTQTIVVGVAGFEPATYSSQSCRDNRTTLHPDMFFLRRGGDSNPRYTFDVRQFSKLLVSATHPPLLKEKVNNVKNDTTYLQLLYFRRGGKGTKNPDDSKKFYNSFKMHQIQAQK